MITMQFIDRIQQSVMIIIIIIRILGKSRITQHLIIHQPHLQWQRIYRPVLDHLSKQLKSIHRLISRQLSILQHFLDVTVNIEFSSRIECLSRFCYF